VEKAMALAAEFVRPKIVDVGTGSGAIAVALAHALPFAEITATDISADAQAVAKANVARNGVADRVRFFKGDLLEAVAGEHFDIVISNPPYVPESDRTTLDVEVRDYEPAQALFAGEDGLQIYRRLIPAAFDALVPGGYLALEIGYGQRAGIEALLVREGFAGIKFIPDLQGIARVAVARRSSS
jgi:release factor glutamine methyltransferase